MGVVDLLEEVPGTSSVASAEGNSTAYQAEGTPAKSQTVHSSSCYYSCSL